MNTSMGDTTEMTRAQRVTVLRRFLTNYARLLASGQRARLEGTREEREEAMIFFDAMMGLAAAPSGRRRVHEVWDFRNGRL